MRHVRAPSCLIAPCPLGSQSGVQHFNRPTYSRRTAFLNPRYQREDWIDHVLLAYNEVIVGIVNADQFRPLALRKKTGGGGGGGYVQAAWSYLAPACGDTVGAYLVQVKSLNANDNSESVQPVPLG